MKGMKKMKKIAVILALLLTAAMLTACGSSDPKKNEQPAQPAVTEATATDAVTEAPTERPTDEPTEAPTEAPTETPTDEPTEAPTEVPTDEVASASEPEEGEQKENAGPRTLAERIETIAADAADLVPFTADELTDITGIVPEDYTDFVFLQGDGMDGREILAVTAKDKEAGNRIEEQMQNYLQRRRDENRNYAPAAYQLLAQASVVRRDLTLAMISGADAAAETEKLLAGE